MTNQKRLRGRIIHKIREHFLFMIVLIIGAVVWSLVFQAAMIDFLTFPGSKPFRSMWNGIGQFEFFGYTVEYYFEGWADHDFYYVNWAEQFLKGERPYTWSFEHPIVNGTEYYAPYFFPPLFIYVCAFGRLLPFEPFGIGFMISVFGYLTAFPVYGISSYLTKKRGIGAISAATYLLNPLILYHTAFQWLNPAPFVFFIMLSFYLFMRGNRTAGTLAIVTAALFKQTAFFLALPVIAYLLKKPPGAPVSQDELDKYEQSEKKIPLSDRVDLGGFLKIVIMVLVYVAVISVPFIPDLQNYLFNILSRSGAINITDFQNPPAGNSPISIAVPFVILGAPEWVPQTLNYLSYYSIGIIIGILPLFVLMLFTIKDDNDLEGYWRRILYFTLLLLLWFHLFSPRGIYKYYCVVLIPFFSIISASRMASKDPESLGFSIPMAFVPLVFSMMILIPDRNIYLLYLLLIFVIYVLHRPIGKIYGFFAKKCRTGILTLYAKIASLWKTPKTNPSLEIDNVRSGG